MSYNNLKGGISVANADHVVNTTLVFAGIMTFLSVVGILYFLNKHRQSKQRADEDRENFVMLFVPFLLLSALILWLLFFRNPYKASSTKAPLKYSDWISGGAGRLASRIMSGATDSMAKSSLSKKFVLGFISGITSILIFNNDFNLLDSYLKGLL